MGRKAPATDFHALQREIKEIERLEDEELNYLRPILFCYLRVSTKGQVEDGHSIQNQRAIGKRLARKLDMTYYELNEGGKSSSTGERPVFEEMKNAIMRGQLHHLWYYSRSRYTRTSIEDMIMKQTYFKPYKTTIYEGENGTIRNFNDASSSMLDEMLTTVQQFDRLQRREISISGKRHLSRANGENGVFMGGTINFGYANVNKQWTVNKEEAVHVKKMFSMYMQGKSMQDIKSHLDSKGVKPRRSKLWNIGSILAILNNTVYLGEYNWVDKESLETFNIRFEPIITHSMFKRVSNRIDKNKKNQGNNRRQYDSLLSDFMVCSCGEKIAGNVFNTVDRKVYLCASKHNKWKGKITEECFNRRSMNMDLTDDFIVSKIREIVTNSTILKERFKEDILATKGFESSKVDLEKSFREKSISKVNKQIELSVKSISANEVNHMLKKTEDAIYEEIKRVLEEEKVFLEDKKATLVAEIEELDNRKDWLDWVGRYGEDMTKKFENVTTELLEGIVDSIIVHPSHGYNRDEVKKQLGHRMIVNFKQPIVEDSIEYHTDNKSDGYNVINGKKMIKLKPLAIPKGGRGKTAKKNHRI